MLRSLRCVALLLVALFKRQLASEWLEFFLLTLTTIYPWLASMHEHVLWLMILLSPWMDLRMWMGAWVDQGWPRSPTIYNSGQCAGTEKAMQAQKGGGGRVRRCKCNASCFQEKKGGHFNAFLAFTNGCYAQILTFVHTACRGGDRSWGFTNSLRSDEAATSRITTRARGFPDLRRPPLQ